MSATREYNFIVGPETSTLPSVGTPSASSDSLTLGYADDHYVQGGDPVADLTALAAIAAVDRTDGDAILVLSSNVFYRFNSASAAAADGTRIVAPAAGSGRWIRSRAGETATTGDVSVDRDLAVTRNLTVTGDLTVNGTTVTVNTDTLDVEDPNITVNKGGLQATANTNKAGIKVEMSDATHVYFGYASSLASRFKCGDSGSESEVMTVGTVQTITAVKSHSAALEALNQNEHRFYEQTGNGTNYVGFKAPDAVTANKIWKLPDGDGSSGQYLGTDGSGNLSFSTPPGAQDAASDLKNHSLAASVAASALTINLKTKSAGTPSSTDIVSIGTRNSTLTTGTYNIRTVTGALSIVVPSTATLGHSSTSAHYIYVYAIDNAGTIELAVSSTLQDEAILQSTTTIGAGSTSLTGFYSTTGRSSVAIRYLGRMLSTQTTAGTWAVVPSEISTSPNHLPLDNQKMPDEVATRLGYKTYVADKSGGGNDTAYNAGNKATISTSPNATSSVKRAVLVPYQMQDGSWRLKFNIAAVLTSSDNSVTLTVNGITFKNTTLFRQAVSTAVDNTALVTVGRAIPNTATMSARITGASTDDSYYFSGDCELDSKPTWAY